MPLLLVLVACGPFERLGVGGDRDEPAMGGDQFGESSTYTRPTPGGVHVLRGAEALGGDAGIPVVVGPLQCGYALVAPGDVDGDGIPDLVVSCGWGDGVDMTYLSGAELLDGAASVFATVTAPVVGDRGALALGDLDGDGRGEVGLEPAWGSLDQHALRDWGLVIPGGAASGAVRAVDVGWHVQADGDWYPRIAASPAGDLDGDGIPDVAVAAEPSSFTATGTKPESRVYVVSGAVLAGTPWGGAVDATSAPLVDLPGTRPVGPARSVAGVGDVDGDGRGDLGVVPSPWEAWDQTGRASPAVRIALSGTPAALLDDVPEITTSAAEREGDAEVVGLGDLDGDGLDEIAVRLRAFGSSEDRWDGLAVVPGSAIPSSGTLSVEPYLLIEADAAEIEPCDLDGDGLPELVTYAGIWAGTDLLTPGAPPVAEGLWGSPTCLGDLDGDGTSELAWGDPWLQ